LRSILCHFLEPAKLKFPNWNYLIDLDVQDEAVDHKNRNLQDSIEIPKLENNNLINLGAQDEEAESHKTGRKNKITKSNWNSGAEMTLVVNQCARWRSRAPNRNYKIPSELARITKHRNAIFPQCLHNRSHKTEIQFLEGSLQEWNH
jgi:hypothetical protein